MEKVLRGSDDGILVYVAPTKALVTQIAAEVYARFKKEVPGGLSINFPFIPHSDDNGQGAAGRYTRAIIVYITHKNAKYLSLCQKCSLSCSSRLHWLKFGHHGSSGKSSLNLLNPFHII
jgi:hypothetical protein